MSRRPFGPVRSAVPRSTDPRPALASLRRRAARLARRVEWYEGPVSLPASRDLPGDVERLFERQYVEEEVFVRVLKESVHAVEEAGIAYVMIGGIPSSIMGRNRWTEDGADIDFFVKPQDAPRIRDVLG